MGMEMTLKTTILVLCALFLSNVEVSLCGNKWQEQMRVHTIQKSYDRKSSNVSGWRLESTTSTRFLSRVKRSVIDWKRMNGIYSWARYIYRDTPEMTRLFPNLMAASLRLAGIYLAAHKYFEVDRRYTFSTTRYEDRKFFKHFPIPRLKKLHPVVQRECNKGAFECITEIANVANMSGSLAKFHKKYKKGSIPPEYPFSSALEQFQYRTTASYFLCWYADLGDDLLTYEENRGCFEGLENVQEAADGKTIYDIRSSDVVYFANMKRKAVSPFTCAYLWFCPDPCYGKSYFGGVQTLDEARADPLNPCSRLKNKNCFWGLGKNTNFEYLIKNRINYTCMCESERKGFVWSPKYSICIDQDECYDDVADCSSDKICRNTVGSYKCQCRRGFKLNSSTNICERHALFRPKSHVGLKRNVQQEESPTGIWAAIDRLFGLNSSSETHYSVSVHIVAVLLCFMLQSMVCNI